MDVNVQVNSRPKVHRLPNMEKVGIRLRLPKVILLSVLALLLVAVIPVATFIKLKVSSMTLKHDNIVAVETGVSPLDSELLVRDDKGQVVGQMAKIPLDAGSGMNVKTTNNGENNTSKELLNIVGKY